ncbi:MAG TPA: hypothetical protein VG674_20510 [Amycolatopsis sp.]|nr:hypothetical protein [Amycolatopsis sp.]
MRNTGSLVLLASAVAVSAAANVVTSALGLNVFVSVAFGLLTLALGTALVVRHRRNN